MENGIGEDRQMRREVEGERRGRAFPAPNFVVSIMEAS
jgi:hypothetical protein